MHLTVTTGCDFAIAPSMLSGFEAVTERIIACAIEVHKHTGPGLLESVYDACLAREFQAAHLRFGRQVLLPIVYKNEPVDCSFRIDYIVELQILIELKSFDAK